jgi:hypothetical protein
MQASSHDIAHLSALIEAALAEAKRLGSSAANVADTLTEALREARKVAAHGSHPDEGIAPAQLTTENDR